MTRVITFGHLRQTESPHGGETFQPAAANRRCRL
jgi:hypothetical protein